MYACTIPFTRPGVVESRGPVVRNVTDVGTPGRNFPIRLNQRDFTSQRDHVPGSLVRLTNFRSIATFDFSSPTCATTPTTVVHQDNIPVNVTVVKEYTPSPPFSPQSFARLVRVFRERRLNCAPLSYSRYTLVTSTRLTCSDRCIRPNCPCPVRNSKIIAM
jgi:hypothetical protein